MALGYVRSTQLVTGQGKRLGCFLTVVLKWPVPGGGWATETMATLGRLPVTIAGKVVRHGRALPSPDGHSPSATRHKNHARGPYR